MAIMFQSIGIIHTPFLKPVGIPIQGALDPENEGTVEIFKEFEDGLKDIEGFSHLILLYHFHLVTNYTLIAKPFLNHVPRGIFAIRGPRRPNPIGMTVVKLAKREENILTIRGVDMINGTPLIDIKPYIPSIDSHATDKLGWLGKKMRTEGKKLRSDGRFLEK